MGDSPTDEGKKLSNTQLTFWLINRYDVVRGAIANRAAIVLSADAIVLAAVVLLLDKTLASAHLFRSGERLILALAIGLTLGLLSISIYFATTAVANVWKISRDLLGEKAPERDFFYPRETLEKSKTATESAFESFNQRFNAASEEQLHRYALGELWSVTNAAYNRYQTLRKAIRYAIFSLVPLLLTLLIFLYRLL